MVNPKFDKLIRTAQGCLVLLLIVLLLTSCNECGVTRACTGSETPSAGRTNYSTDTRIQQDMENRPAQQEGLEAMRTATAPKKPIATSQP